MQKVALILPTPYLPLLVCLWLGLSLSLSPLRSPLLLGRLLCGLSLGTVVLADRLNNRLLLLWLNDCDGIRQGLLWARLALRVGAAHDLDLDTKHTLAEQ